MPGQQLANRATFTPARGTKGAERARMSAAMACREAEFKAQASMCNQALLVRRDQTGKE
jgi:hypothetical protein